MSRFTRTFHRRAYEAISPTLPSLTQEGRTILITGGGTGIGYEIARAFVTAGAARIIIASRTESTLAQSKAQLEAHAKGSATVIEILVLDMSSESSIDACWNSLREKGTEVHTLILSAADFGNEAPKIALSNVAKQLRRAYELNVFGNWQMSTLFIEQGPKKGKVLINISSAAMHMNPVILPAYSTTKAAFVHAVQALADETPREEVQMINVHPGAVFTENAKRSGMTADALPWDSADLPAHFMVWASSREASFLHGRFVWANWDVDELKELEKSMEHDAELLRLALKGTQGSSMASYLEHMAELDQAKKSTASP